MNRNEIDFCERMELGKQAAMERRNKGLPTGKPAAGWNRKLSDYAPVDPRSWEFLAMQVRAAWRHDCREAQEAFRFAVYPERYEPIDL
jgi:hypothetical protein